MLEFYKSFANQVPMKYYDSRDHTKTKAKDMIANKDNQFRGFLKADGEWSRAIIMHDEVILQSRSVSTVTGTYGIKTEHVPHIAAELLSNYPKGTVLLGELGYEDITKTSKDVGSILRCLVPKALKRQENTKLIFRVFDCLAFDMIDLRKKPFDERFLSIFVTPSSLFQMREPMAQYIQVVEEIEGDFMEYAEDLWRRGGEGIMIVRRDMKYMGGSRKAWDTLKIKKKLGHIDVKVIDALEPTKYYTGSQEETWKFWEVRPIGMKETLLVQTLDESEVVTVGNHEPIEGFISPYNGVDVNYSRPVTKPHYMGWKSAIQIEYKGKKIKVASGLTDEDKAYLATDAAKDAIESGSLFAVITGMELTEESIRHPVFIDFRHK